MRGLNGSSARLMSNVGVNNTDADNVVERSVIHRNPPGLDD
jgi:hypothetical protein